MIKTFRGLIADGAQDTIVLHTPDGSTGYRIVKFEVMTVSPGDGSDAEHILQIWSVEQDISGGTSPDVDFSKNTLLGVGLAKNNTAQADFAPQATAIIFDKMIFNQDIYITHKENTAATLACNYYLELEQVKLDLNENTVATLKDIRNITQP